MPRIPSFKYVPSETRCTLRHRFVSKLLVYQQRRLVDPDLELTSDQLVLRLLANLEISDSAEWSTAEAAYANAGPTASEPADLHTLSSLGWLRQIWGRAVIGIDLRLAAQQAPAGVMDAFKVLLSGINNQHREVSTAIRSNAELAALIQTVEASNSDSMHVVSRTPEWVAARLWEEVLAQETSPDKALRRWVDLWSLLQHPLLVPGAVWSTTDANAFREAAFSTISTDPALGGWAETYNLYVRQAALTHNVTVAIAESRLPRPPETLVDRAIWMQLRLIEASVYNSLAMTTDLFGLVRLLLADVDTEEFSPAPHAVAAQIIDLAIDRTELFIDLIFLVQSRPKLLADLVIHPPTSALACLLIAQWRYPGGAWDRSLTERDRQIGQAEAFADAVSIFGEHLRAGKTTVGEAAALFNWMHDRTGRGFIDDVIGADSLIASLRRELASCAGSIILAVAQSLDGPGLRKGLGSSEFAAILDLSDLGGIEDDVDADTVIASYANSIIEGGYSLSAQRIGITGAVALARIAGRTQTLRTQFLYPLDVYERLRATTPEENEFIIADSIGHSLRTHIQVLCRAIIGGEMDVGADLFDALVVTVRTGALQHKEKGRVAAFAPRFEKHIAALDSDRSLATDLAAVLLFVDRPRQERLLSVILETDEPLILAQLLPKSPPNFRSEIERRITALVPTDAGAIYSLIEMQARVDELLTAGAADAAAIYMEAEAGLTTLGKAAGRELVRFQNQLRLHFLQGNWRGILDTVAPNFPASEQQTAIETLRTFQGLAAIKGPNANPESAKILFADLFAKSPSLSCATNWFAAEVSVLLQADSFGLLKGDQIRKGRKAIAELERMTSQLPGASTEEAMECNRALLLLALGEPSQALTTLLAVSFTHLQDTAAAYRAIAMARLGQRSEATAVLDAAEHTHGRTTVLAAARSHIASGAPFLSVPDVSVYDSLVENVGAAIARFRTMNPAEQAQVLQRQADPFEALLIDYVRSAADSVVSLVPMMKGVKIDAIEDDLTAFIQHLLVARIQFLGWSVADQSKGGFSGKGNAGERDLLVTWGGSVLTVIEAVVCKKSLAQNAMRADLESHFQKLLGYSSPRIFFHLTYAYVEDKQALMQFLETSAETVSPPGFTYLGREPIPHDDSRPIGFVARYSGDFGEVKVVFLILNLGQQRQRQAAKTAAATKARKAPKKIKTTGSINDADLQSKADATDV